MTRRILSILTAVLLVFGGSYLLPKNQSTVHAQAAAKCLATGATPLQCQSAAYGIVSIAASASSVQVYTTAVTANAIILLTFDGSTTTGTNLGVTCNTTAQTPYVSARSLGASFTISTASTFTSNPGCIQFFIIQQ